MTETLQAYFKQVGKTKLLTREDEVMLSQRIEKGDQRARDRMIRANLRLAISIAKKYQNNGLDRFSDRRQDYVHLPITENIP